jgi:hypothetical protein
MVGEREIMVEVLEIIVSKQFRLSKVACRPNRLHKTLSVLNYLIKLLTISDCKWYIF